MRRPTLQCRVVHNSYIYCGQKRMENKGQISLVRVEGLVKKLKMDEELRQITEFNRTWNT